MKKINLFFAAALVVGMTLLVVGSAEANVKVIGRVQVVSVAPDEDNHYIHVVQRHHITVGPARYYCYTNDDTLINAAKDAIRSNLTVRLYCNAASWSPGSVKFGGEAYFINVYRSL